MLSNSIFYINISSYHIYKSNFFKHLNFIFVGLNFMYGSANFIATHILKNILKLFLRDVQFGKVDNILVNN